MYEEIEAHAADFNGLRATITNQDNARIDVLCHALDQTAERLAETKGHSDLDRNNLARLYRGFAAASRVLRYLQEVHRVQANKSMTGA